MLSKVDGNLIDKMQFGIMLKANQVYKILISKVSSKTLLNVFVRYKYKPTSFASCPLDKVFVQCRKMTRCITFNFLIFGAEKNQSTLRVVGTIQSRIPLRTIAS
ncbi:hypothetical protein A0256_00715 [Mucilaginibacter sp. PAMC 26640]|nr:hypothetical protein A0256_00715 [Mucilaginibacter sp. PAMC 26640]